MILGHALEALDLGAEPGGEDSHSGCRGEQGHRGDPGYRGHARGPNDLGRVPGHVQAPAVLDFKLAHSMAGVRP
jgi:hypothetical protein